MSRTQTKQQTKYLRLTDIYEDLIHSKPISEKQPSILASRYQQKKFCQNSTKIMQSSQKASFSNHNSFMDLENRNNLTTILRQKAFHSKIVPQNLIKNNISPMRAKQLSQINGISKTTKNKYDYNILGFDSITTQEQISDISQGNLRNKSYFSIQNELQQTEKQLSFLQQNKNQQEQENNKKRLNNIVSQSILAHHIHKKGIEITSKMEKYMLENQQSLIQAIYKSSNIYKLKNKTFSHESHQFQPVAKQRLAHKVKQFKR